MSKKQDSFYFETFITCTDYACKAAHLLESVMEGFSASELPARLEEIHALEHAADEQKHILLNVLSKAFITPIEREDIIQLAQCLDEVTDNIEDVLLRIYYNNVTKIKADALKLAHVVVRCCGALKDMVTELADFRHSKTLQEQIIRINTMEEEADKLFISSMYELHKNGGEPLDILAWREVYIYLEKCADACEHVADVVESVVMKNS